jgi:hypothetical protein
LDRDVLFEKPVGSGRLRFEILAADKRRRSHHPAADIEEEPMKPGYRAVRAFLPCVVVVATLLLVAGCKGTTPIKTLLDDPSQFDGKSVKIAGAVTGAVGVLGTGAYQVDDGTGRLVVISQEGGAPREGAQVAVKGVFRAAFTFQTETAAVLMESERYTR